MKTLKEISAMSPSQCRVIDFAEMKGKLKSWDDTIQIIIDGKTKNYKRRSAYKFGLASKAD